MNTTDTTTNTEADWRADHQAFIAGKYAEKSTNELIHEVDVLTARLTGLDTFGRDSDATAFDGRALAFAITELVNRGETNWTNN